MAVANDPVDLLGHRSFLWRYRWPVVLSLASLVANLAYLVWWGSIVHGVAVWETSSDLWGMLRAAHYIDWGGLGGIYSPGNGVVTLPGMPLLLSPVALLDSVFRLTESYPPFLLPRPTAALLVQPIEMALGCTLLFATEAVARRLGISERRRIALCVMVAVVAWPISAVWGHAEDAVAVALALLALSALVDKRWVHAGWLFGFGILMQPLVLMTLPIAAGFAPRSKRAPFLLRAGAFPVLLLAIAFVGAPNDTYRAVVEQPTQPFMNHATPWVALAPVLVRGRSYVGEVPQLALRGSHLRFVADTTVVHVGSTVAGGPGRWIYLGVAVAVGMLVARRRERVSPAVLFWLAATVLALRCWFESVMTPYYLGPPLVAILLCAALRSGRCLALASVLSVSITVFAYARLGSWAWWTPLVLVFAGLVLASRPALDGRVDVEHCRSLPPSTKCTPRLELSAQH